MAKQSKCVDWLLSEGRQAGGPGLLLSGLCNNLRYCGVPVDRATIGAPLLHPIAQSSFVSWSVEEGGKESWLRWTPENRARMRNSPIFTVYNRGRGDTFRLTSPRDRERFAITRDLADQGFIEYATFPLAFSDGSFKAFSCATRNAGGFASADYDVLQAVLPALATVLETMVLRKTSETLLNTYVGRRAGRRVLDGEIHRGDGSRIPAVVLFSDIRGFTGLSARLVETELLDRLNTYFGAVDECIERQGGEILKFIGDAVLAIFPVEGELAVAVQNAEQAVDEIRSVQKSEDWPEDLSFGIGLHSGEIFFGNVGGTQRLDFTVIGGAVNIASRIEGLCSALSETVLVSREIRDVSKRVYRDCGTHKLKGVSGTVRVYAPIDSRSG